ncbi:MAG TPA: hypothetical protein VGI99_01875 [Gemmataceae bacterium]
MPKILGASSYTENFHGCKITDEEWAFMKAMEAYQRRWRRRYPSWREVLFVLECLGYRKVADAVPVAEAPPTPAELEFAATARRACGAEPASLPV